MSDNTVPQQLILGVSRAERVIGGVLVATSWVLLIVGVVIHCVFPGGMR